MGSQGEHCTTEELFLQFTQTASGSGQDLSALPRSDQLRMSIKAVISLMLGFCKMSQSDILLVQQSEAQGDAIGDQLDADDAGELNDLNTFLISFLESDEDQLNQVSIRLSINEFIEQIIDEGSLTIYGGEGFSSILH